MKKISLLFLLILLSCGPSKKAIIVEYSESIIPELNKQSQSEIGETLIEKESGFKYDGIKLLNGTKAEKTYVYREVKAGDIFIKKSEMNEYDLYEGTDQYFGIAIPKNGGIPSFYFYNGHVSFYKTVENLTSMIKNHQIELWVNPKNLDQYKFLKIQSTPDLRTSIFGILVYFSLNIIFSPLILLIILPFLHGAVMKSFLCVL